MKALRKHVTTKWILLYIERWLTAPIQLESGELQQRSSGTPQGGVVSPCLANLFLHYAFDAWMARAFPEMPWCRYADDGLVHCRSEAEAKYFAKALKIRLAECGLTLHPEKTKIVYCKDSNRTQPKSSIKFDFLGYTFRPRLVRNMANGKVFVSFSPAASNDAMREMCQTIRSWNFRNRTDLELADMARMFNPTLRGWIGYYSRFNSSVMNRVFGHFNMTIVRWAMRKFRYLKGRKSRAIAFVAKIARDQPKLFAHWSKGSFLTADL